jgi:hypothetical protein
MPIFSQITEDFNCKAYSPVKAKKTKKSEKQVLCAVEK